MAHNLEENNGTTSFFANVEKEMPWHKLGQLVVGAKTWKEAIELSNMNWEVSKINLIHPLTGKSLPDVFGIFRNDNNEFLGNVGNVYVPIQNKQAFEFVDSLLEVENGAHYETAGVLGKGERIFCSVKVPFAIAPDRAPEDKTYCYLMFTNSHNGKHKAMAKLTTIRPVCQNTLNMALNDSGFGEIVIKHTGRGQLQLETAKKCLQNVKQNVDTLKEKFNKLANRRISVNAYTEVMKSLFGEEWETTRQKNINTQIASIFDNNDGNAFPELKGSAYALTQAITNYYDHHAVVKVTKGKGELTEELIRTESAIFGANDIKKSVAIDKILEATKHCSPMPEKTSIVVPSKLDDILSKVAC